MGDLPAAAQLHDNVEKALLLERLVHLDDVGVVQPPQYVNLLPELVHVDLQLLHRQRLEREQLTCVAMPARGDPPRHALAENNGIRGVVYVM